MQVSGHGEKITRKQEALISALLTAPTMAAAAKTAHLAEATVRRWMQDTDFQVAYREARREAVQHAIGQLQAACSVAVLLLRSVMLDQAAPVSSRVSAAKIVLEMSLRAVEVEDIEERLTRLEARMEAP